MKSKEFSKTDYSCFKVEWDCHCKRERSEGRGNQLVSRGTRTGLSLRLLVHSGSPRAFLNALAMTRWGGKDVGGSVTSRSLSLRGGNVSDRRGNPLCLEGRGRLSLRLLVPSGSPRAFLNALAMTRWGKDSESPISTEIVPIWIIFFD